MGKTKVSSRRLSKVPKQLRESSARLIAENDKGLGMKHGVSRPISVMLPPDLEAWVRSLDNKSEWIRNACIEKFQRDHANN